MTETADSKTNSQTNWFGRAAKSSILNALWLGPVNIFFWFSSDRFADPYYTAIARQDNVTLDEVIAGVLIVEMLLMVLSLFVVFAIFYVSKATQNIYTAIIFLVFATLLWNGLGIAFGL